MPRLREDSVAAVRRGANLRAVVERVVPLKGRADDLVGPCPFHAERTPSFHVHPERGFFKCFGCGKSGDAIGFVRDTENLSFAEAVEALGSRFSIPVFHEDGIQSVSAPSGVIRPAVSRPIPTREPSAAWLRIQPDLRQGTLTELRQLASLRRLPSIAGLELATRAQTLFFTELHGHTAWLITDPSRRNAQARRLDGQPWADIDAKAKTIAGCEAGWPIGIHGLRTRGIAMIEGGPDFLAAWHFVWFYGRVNFVTPVAMLGAAQNIHPDALPLFRDHDVWIFPHADESGAAALARWSQSLTGIAASVQAWDFRLQGVKDLNDLATADAAHDDA